jgi:hypothetical protein
MPWTAWRGVEAVFHRGGTMTNRAMIPILAASAALLGGCHPGSPNRSPTPEADPGRHARAVIEAEDVHRANQAAEAAFYRRIGSVGLPDPDDGTAGPSGSRAHIEVADTEPGGITP